MNQDIPLLTLASVEACVRSIRANGPFTREQSVRLDDLYKLAIKIQGEIVYGDKPTD